MIAVMPVFCLSLHAAYACRHSGECCRAGWDIPAEPAVVEVIEKRVAIGGPAPVDRFHTSPDGRVIVSRGSDGACVFFEHGRGPRSGPGLCAIHRQAGPEHLPSACRHFPRVVLRDPRGTFVTLSHFCPTVAALLLESGPLAIVEAPPSLALDGRLEGLDATSVLPPLVGQGVLMDYEGLSAWERAGIAVLDRDDLDVERALAVIASATSAVTRWSPGRESLADAVERAFDLGLGRSERRGAEALEDRPLRAFLAAHLFASWDAYQPRGLQDVVDGLRTALATLRHEMRSHGTLVEAARAADLQLRHRTA